MELMGDYAGPFDPDRELADPVHVPEYTDIRVELDGDDAVVTLRDCAALHDDPRSPLAVLTATPATPGFEHMAQATNPRARPETPVELTGRS